MALCLLEGSARMTDADGHEFHLSLHRFEIGDTWGVLGGLPLKSFLTSEVLAKSDLNEDKVALLAVESAWVRRRDFWYSCGVDEVGGGAVSRPEKGLLGLVG